MSHLKFKEIKVGDIIDWHDDYQHKYVINHPEKCILTEEWKDCKGPITVIHVSKVDKFGYIGYKCSDQNCKRCKLLGHHKLIRFSGLDPHGRVEFREAKKRTLITVKDQPVFRKI